MIQYALQCSKGHQFDAWFSNAEAFDNQKALGLVSCAVCGEAAVDKALMAPALARNDGHRHALSAGHTPEKVRELLRAYREAVTAQADYVGDRFAEEARKIHFEEVAARQIYGEASADEVAGLAEDGIAFMPLPDLPEEHN